jgi:hypothetical protein
MSVLSNDTILSFFQSEDIKKYMKETIRSIVLIIYNEMYFYVWLICFYHVFLIFIVLANLFILLRIITFQKGHID